jgi:hypothetical protein
MIAASAATEPAESGAGLGVSVGSALPVGVEEVPEDVGEPPVPVGVGDPVPVGVGDPVPVGVGDPVSVGGGVVDPVLGGGVVDPVLGGGVDAPVLGGGVDEPDPGDFAGGLDECCGGVARAGRFSTLHCRFVAG